MPAAFNNIVGLKPTPGLLSNAGVVPACASLDCISFLSLTVEALSSARRRVWRRSNASSGGQGALTTFATPNEKALDFLGDLEREDLFKSSVKRLEQGGSSDRCGPDAFPGCCFATLRWPLGRGEVGVT